MTKWENFYDVQYIQIYSDIHAGTTLSLKRVIRDTGAPISRYVSPCNISTAS